MYPMEQNNVLDAGVPCTLFPMIIEFPFERKTACLSGFSSVRNISFVQNGSTQVNGSSTVSLLKNQ
jgi:hypothetical protein